MNKIIHLRKKLKFTQIQMSKLTGISRSRISEFECDSSIIPAYISVLCDILLIMVKNGTIKELIEKRME